ncbi:MAG: DNA-protecting protein DprA, partial [Candidatus Rokubacteria bacterium]|nr:DNA-protecting protein DprA [Candidatus Rokubacteria bacterium]
MDEGWDWVALAMVPGIGLARYYALLEAWSPTELFGVSRRDLAARVGGGVARAVAGFDRARAIARQRREAERVGAALLTLRDAGYPPALRAIPLPPPFLFVRGALTAEDALAIAIVGSRRPSPYGVRTATRLAADLAARGVTVVSGFARGIDTAAHRGALEAAGRTVAVLGSGVDAVYPPENRRLIEAVTRQGAIVSEFPMGTPPLSEHFPRRNRVIAGLALGTAVVEAAEKSGALITAGCAG